MFWVRKFINFNSVQQTEGLLWVWLASTWEAKPREPGTLPLRNCQLCSPQIQLRNRFQRDHQEHRANPGPPFHSSMALTSHRMKRVSWHACHELAPCLLLHTIPWQFHAWIVVPCTRNAIASSYLSVPWDALLTLVCLANSRGPEVFLPWPQAEYLLSVFFQHSVPTSITVLKYYCFS